MNIELCGFPSKNAKVIQKNVWDYLCGKTELARESMVTIAHCSSQDVYCRRVPFVRIYSDNEKDFMAALDILEDAQLPGGGIKVYAECVLLHKCFEI